MDTEVFVPRKDITPALAEIVETGLETFKNQLNSYFQDVNDSNEFHDATIDLV